MENCVPDFEMVIAFKHNQPITCRLLFADKEALRKILDELLDRGVIRCNDSLYANPIVLSRKTIAFDYVLIIAN